MRGRGHRCIVRARHSKREGTTSVENVFMFDDVCLQHSRSEHALREPYAARRPRCRGRFRGVRADPYPRGAPSDSDANVARHPAVARGRGRIDVRDGGLFTDQRVRPRWGSSGRRRPRWDRAVCTSGCERHFSSWMSFGGRPSWAASSEFSGRIASGVCAAFFGLFFVSSAVAGVRRLRKRL